MSKKAKINFVEASSAVSLYTIVFEDDDLSEFQKFTVKFKDNSELRKDYQAILIALDTILEKGALERYFSAGRKI